MKLRDLFVSIGFDVDDKELKRLDQGLRQTKTLILAVGAAAVASAGMLYKMATSVADAGDKAAKTADKLGVQIEALQELRYAAELSGVAQNNFDIGLQRMTRRAAEAAAGTGVAKDAFKELGVVLKDNQGHVRSSEDLLADVAAGMAGIEDPSRRVALAFKLFDTEGVSMVNMLRSGKQALADMRKEARSLGFVIGEEDARNAERFTDDLTRTRLIITGLRNEVGAKLLPVLSDLMVQLRSWFMLNRQIIKSGLEKTVRNSIALLRWLYGAVRSVVGVLSDMVDMFGGIERVATAAAWAMGLFAGAQVLSALANMAMGLMGIVSVLRAVRVAALLANAAAMAIPVLIGAAVAAAILIIQDLVSYFQGKKSVTAVMLAVFEKHLPMIYKLMTFTIGDALSWIEKAFDAAVDWIMEKLAPLLGAIGTVRQWLQSAGAKATGAWQAAQSFFTIGPDDVPVRGGVSNQNDVRINAPVTVTVPENTPAEAVGRAVRQGVSDGIARMLRDTALATEPQVEY